MNTVALVAGTRPECVKMAPVYFALRESPRVRPVFVSTGQHRQMLGRSPAALGIATMTMRLPVKRPRAQRNTIP